MYTLQHTEIGSQWAEEENDSRRNTLYSYGNKPETSYSLFKSAGQYVKSVVFLMLLLKTTDQNYAGN